MPIQFLSTKEASSYVGVSVSTLEKKRVYGGGPVYLKVGRLVKYRESDLEQWMQRFPCESTSNTVEAHGHRRDIFDNAGH